MYELKVTQPGRPKGSKVTVAGVGEVKVGETVTVTDQQARDFKAAHSYLWAKDKPDAGLDEVLADSTMFEVKRIPGSKGTVPKKSTEAKKDEGSEG